MTLFLIGTYILLRVRYPVKYNAEIVSACEEFGVDETLVRAVIWTESKYKPNAESRAGAKGLMQLMPSTAAFCAGLCGEEFDESEIKTPSVNIRLGVCYLSYLLNKFDERNAVAAYNAGEGNVKKWTEENIKEYPFKETRDYVERVFNAKKIYRFVISLSRARSANATERSEVPKRSGAEKSLKITLKATKCF